MTFKKRYLTLKGSQSGHCCFEATVVDTTKPVMIGSKHYNDQYEIVCECYDYDTARRVETALNGESL